MSKGLNLSYNYKKTKPIIDMLERNNFEIDVHGIAFDDKMLMFQERDRFFDITGFEHDGIYTRYLILKYVQEVFDDPDEYIP